MSQFILPNGHIHTTLVMHKSLIQRGMMVTWAAIVASPPFVQSNNDALYTALSNAWKPVYDSSYSFDQLITLVGTGGVPARFVTQGAVAGNRSGATEITPQVAMLMIKGTGLSGRRYRGRNYLPAPQSSDVNELGVLSATVLALANTACVATTSALNTPAVVNTEGQVLLHSEEPSTPTLVTTYSPSSVCATQRRRLVRVT